MRDRDLIMEAYSLDVARELVINRYLLNTILTNLFLINEQMNINFSIIGGKKRKENQKKESSKERNNKRKEKKVRPYEEVRFEFFAISQAQYKALIDEYGIDIINEAVILVDSYIKRTKRNIKAPYYKLKSWAIHLVMKKRLTDLTDDVTRVTADKVNVDKIDSMAEAIRYIRRVPTHLRNVDTTCKALVEKFNIKEEFNYGKTDKG